MQEIIDFSLIPAVDSFAQQTLKLSESANTFCATPTENQLTALQQNWKNAYDSWFRLANYVFGPLDDDIIFPTYTFIDSLRLRGTDYLNTVRVENAADINGTHTLDNRYFSNKTFQRVGLLALESILFETTSSDRSTAKPDIVNEFQSSSRKCEVLQGLTEQLQTHGQSIQHSWKVSTPNASSSYRTQFLDSTLDDGSDPISTLLTQFQAHMEYLQKRNVATTSAKLSQSAWQGISAAIDEFSFFLSGTEETSISLLSLMTAGGFQISVEQINSNLEEVRLSIAAKNPDTLDIALGKLDGNLKRDIPDGLKVDLGINFSDGD